MTSKRTSRTPRSYAPTETKNVRLQSEVSDPDIRLKRHAQRHYRRLLLLLALIPALGVWLVSLRRETSIEQSPDRDRPAKHLRQSLEFDFVMRRFNAARESETRAEVERILGPPTEVREWGRGPELAALEIMLRSAGRNRFFPEQPAWHMWRDPKNDNRWVAVLYNKESLDNAVYGVFKEGF